MPRVDFGPVRAVAVAMAAALSLPAQAQPVADGAVGASLRFVWGAPSPQVGFAAWVNPSMDPDARAHAVHIPLMALPDAREKEGYSAWLYAGVAIAGAALAMALKGESDDSSQAGEFARDEILRQHPPCQPIPRVCLP